MKKVQLFGVSLLVCMGVLGTVFFAYPIHYWSEQQRKETDGWYISTLELHECSLSYKIFGVGYHDVVYKSIVYGDWARALNITDMQFHVWVNKSNRNAQNRLMLRE